MLHVSNSQGGIIKHTISDISHIWLINMALWFALYSFIKNDSKKGNWKIHKSYLTGLSFYCFRPNNDSKFKNLKTDRLLYGSSFYCFSQVSVYTVCFYLMNSNMLICHIWHIISVMLKFNLIYKMQMNAFYGNLSINVEVIICKMNQFSIYMSFHLPYCCYSYLLPCQ